MRWESTGWDGIKYKAIVSTITIICNFSLFSCSAESEAASLKHVRALEEVRVREVAIVDLQRRILEVESRLKQQQNLYESVRSDRNLYSKNLVEAQVRAVWVRVWVRVEVWVEVGVRVWVCGMRR